MRLGLLADIHEDVDHLRLALDYLRAESVDRLILLGDVIETGQRLTETAAILGESGAIGVWGNHDLGLCHEPDAAVVSRFDRPAMGYMASLRPRLELADCLFTHGLPGWDPTDPAIYYTGDRVETPAGRAASFEACRHPVVFVGHFHRWLAATPGAMLEWDGSRPIHLGPGSRWLVVVAAVCDGWCATFDTESRLFTPLRLSEHARQSTYRP